VYLAGFVRVRKRTCTVALAVYLVLGRSPLIVPDTLRGARDVLHRPAGTDLVSLLGDVLTVKTMRDCCPDGFWIHALSMALVRVMVVGAATRPSARTL
jgi:hypothetical protein